MANEVGVVASSAPEAAAVEIVKHPHKLERKWSFWFDNQSKAKQGAAWDSSLRKVYTFETVEEFWWKLGCTIQISRVCCSKLETPRTLESQTGVLNTPQAVSDNCIPLKRFYNSQGYFSKHFVGRWGLSSQTGAENSEDDDKLHDGFSDPELPAASEAVKEGKADDESSSESELSDDEDVIEDSCLNELELSDHGDKPTPEKRIQSELVNAILINRRVSVNSTLDKWIAEGKKLDQMEIIRTLGSLRRRRLYGKALQVHEWVDSHKLYDLAEIDYASRLDLIAKFHGIQKAESYIHSVPESFRGEVLYRTLLANYVGLPNLKKAEEVFGKMKELRFPLTLFTCNQLLLLYSRGDGKKIADILLLMETENVKPDSFTYRMLIDMKCRTNDMAGMDQMLENMKAEGVEPDVRTQIILCRHYIQHGLKEKAYAIMKQMEGGNLKNNREMCQALLLLYADLGQADEVERVWKVCEPKPWVRECITAIAAWGKLKRIEEAEAVFQKMSKISKVASGKIYTALLRVYANNKLLDKGTDLVKQMASDGCRIDPLTWDLLVKLYVSVGDVDKADSLLRRATEKSKEKPLYNSYITIMYEYAKRGDIHNTEKIFYTMKQRGYMIRTKQFQALVLAYRTAKAPAYGIRERMKADNIIPNRSMAMQLTRDDAFRKTAASDLVE